MPPKKSADQDGSPIGLTDGELRFIKAIFDNMTQKPDADWDAVANTVSLKDAKCAKERFRQMSVRHGWRSDGAGSGPSPRKSSASTSSPRQSPAAVRKSRKTNTTRSPSKKSIKKVDEDDEDVKEEAQSEEKKEMKAEVEDDDTN
ncbi:hypothetical protein FOCG_06642 [Fusarium oxysporum f. sp. radicis-lycopersici 26381]|uniref:Uncharacterized protein n=1 Tax=Fusarium oxysporum Fo47 TaxID=660027 RepID=W9KYW8_FUSOX|nr:uncharacterized protein FOBCDRAFT_257342 [Fusarium oxysporum Fo47]EXL53302.1 hypothetical protein FOCG_06642 [Fusarium oxysporum f. sp. radicis-lycopersici 26381]KAJ4122209.1 hypothetical protein NW765_005040 [Fusarium oxysporum]EWZ47969.1 hypothetical protein FOZG_03700 [Fusarium oxysporum Fo47]KAJ4281321.1 hypothetical protein NW764_004015 [Fusarium oxysporum]QKD49780.1 hypothetical protein FOBCDRAFT_257342 [Fusarium oxysporum Fo47]